MNRLHSALLLALVLLGSHCVAQDAAKISKPSRDETLDYINGILATAINLKYHFPKGGELGRISEGNKLRYLPDTKTYEHSYAIRRPLNQSSETRVVETSKITFKNFNAVEFKKVNDAPTTGNLVIRWKAPHGIHIRVLGGFMGGADDEDRSFAEFAFPIGDGSIAPRLENALKRLKEIDSQMPDPFAP